MPFDELVQAVRQIEQATTLATDDRTLEDLDVLLVALDHLHVAEWEDRRQQAVKGIAAHPDLREQLTHAQLSWLNREPFVVSPLGADRDQAMAAYATIRNIVSLREKVTSLEAWRQTVQDWVKNYPVLGIALPLTAKGAAVKALAEPVRIVQDLDKRGELNEGDPFEIMECIPQSFPIDGQATPMTPGATVEYTLPDIYGRPWAQIWERYHEQGMERPKEQGLFGL